jgi:glycerol-3-phosphate dehydrogenase subunit C
MDRVFDLCHGCRLCFNLCPSFPTLFEAVDAHDGRAADLDESQRDNVVDECYQCKLCYLKCPYVPPHEWQLDFPRLMMRVQAVRHAEHHGGVRTLLADQFLGRTDLLGRVSSTLAPLVNATTSRPGSPPRRAMEKTVGVAAERVLPPYSRQRFTTWFGRRREEASSLAPSVAAHDRPPTAEAPGGASRADGPWVSPGQGQVAVFPTCFIEYMDPAIGADLVQVFERNGISCSVPSGCRCCGAPWLHQGDVARFRRAAARNVAALLADARAGREIVVAQPTCGYVLRKDYPLVLRTAESELVAAQVRDPAEHLMVLHRGEGTHLDTDFAGKVPDAITYHAACHLRAQQIGFKSRDLLKLAGAEVRVVSQCSGIDGTWGYRAANYDLARLVAQALKNEVEAAGTATVCGDCFLANGSIRQETGSAPVHPIQVIARAYGIPEHPR